MNMLNTIDPVRSAASLRRGGDLVAADRTLSGAVGVANLAAGRSGRMDSQGALDFIGFRSVLSSLLAQAQPALGIRYDARQVDAIARKLASVRASQGGEGRLDSKALELGSDRLDAANPNAALALARELEYITNEIFREEGPVLSAERLFTIDRSIPAGAKTYTIRRIESSGEMVWWRAGQSIPLVDVGRDEMSLPIRHSVIGLQTEFFDQQADAYAGINSFGEKVRAAREATAEFKNLAYWYGSENQGLYGLLTYPWLRRRKIAQVFDETVASDADFEAKAAALNDMVSEILDRNPGMSASLRFICSPRFHRRMAQSHHPTSQLSLRERFLNDNPSVTGIEEAPELQGTGPGSEDGIFIVPQGERGPRLVLPVDFTMLPVQTSNFGLTKTQAGYCSLGGARFRDVMRSVLIWANIA